jgi:hypothetical protein
LGATPTPAEYFNGYLADIHFIDGQALDPTSFGEFDATTGVWVPIEYTGTYGTNGFHLDFADNASTTTIGYDAAGSNDWTANNLSVTAGAGNDSLVDVPTNGAETDTGAGGEVRGNYCCWNANDKGAQTPVNGNLDVTATNSHQMIRGPHGMTSGKWYWEVTCGAFQPTRALNSVGIDLFTTNINTLNLVGSGAAATGYAYFQFNGNKINNNVSTAYGATYTTNDVIGIALDMDAGTLVFYKNGVSQGTAFTAIPAGT